MNIKTQINDFLQLSKDLNYDVVEIYNQAPMGFYAIIGILVVLIIILTIIKNSIKNSKELGLLNETEELKTFDDMVSNLQKIIQKIPKANNNFISTLNNKKEHYLKVQLKTISKLSIKDTINDLMKLSGLYEELSNINIKNDKLQKYFKIISKDIYTTNITKEIDTYAENIELCRDELDNIVAIVEYANMETNQENTQDILQSLSNRLDNSNLGEDIELLKLTQLFTEENCKQIFELSQSNINATFVDSKEIVSIEVLDYLLSDNQYSTLAYGYIATLDNNEYLQELYNNYFDKENDSFNNLDIDLSFISNDNALTLFSSSYKTYLDNLCTDNWRDADLLEYINNSKNIVTVIGHNDSRKIIERVDNIRQEEENKQILDEALNTAKEARELALEAKEIASGNITEVIKS